MESSSERYSKVPIGLKIEGLIGPPTNISMWAMSNIQTVGNAPVVLDPEHRHNILGTPLTTRNETCHITL